MPGDQKHLSRSRRHHIAVAVESSDTENENGQVAEPKFSRRKQLSTTSVCPTMVLSWHGIMAKPRREQSFLPCLSNIQALFKDDKTSREAYGQKLILNKVYGAAFPGEVLALMGASGAGKTSLLNILTQRNLSTLRFSGHICLNGKDIDKHLLRKISAYVQQEDLFIGTMTVVEHLRFMAVLRMGKNYTKAERERRVQNVMKELGLTHCADTIIGWPHRLKGLSGGERKRLAFASEIMTGPPILFCDEPTSGLDSYLAQQVIQVLKDLARRKHMTILVTIHQPSSQVFELFDKICLLANGRLAFLGAINEAIAFFSGLGYNLPANFNPADHFISTLAIKAKKVKQSKERVETICNAFNESDVGRKLKELCVVKADGSSSSSVEGSISPSPSTSSLTPSSDQQPDGTVVRARGEGHDGLGTGSYRKMTLQRYKSTWFQQFCVLTKRSFFITLREPMLLRVRLFQTLLIGLLLGGIYWNTTVSQSTVMNINGLMFQAVANMNFMFQFAAVHVFCDELPIFMREHSSNLYRVDTYFLAKNVAELVQYIVYPVIFASLVYWMALRFVASFDASLLFTLSCISITNVAVSLAYVSACIFGTNDVSTAVMPIVVIPLLSFGGFYISQESLPSYFYPLKFLSYFGYAYETAAINQWTRVHDIPGCKSQLPHVKSGGVITCDPQNCCSNGTDVLEGLSFNENNLWLDYSIMLGMIIVLRLIAFFALWLRSLVKK
uniref:ABC transporter domain-containing protein n=1 Tax=Globodera pallida TaxID=36090 RepID=A0A183CHT4_GLOPA